MKFVNVFICAITYYDVGHWRELYIRGCPKDSLFALEFFTIPKKREKLLMRMHAILQSTIQTC